MTAYALRLENSTDTAARMRLGDLLGLAPGDSPLTARGGLRPDGGGIVSVVTGAMQVTVQPFVAWVQGGVSTVQGGYPFVLDTAATLAVAEGDPSLDRTDTVAAVVEDDSYDGSGAFVAEVRVVQGTPGLGAPALPTNAVPLRDVQVPAGLSTGLGGLQPSHLGADRRAYVTGAGGTIPVSGQTERDALTVTEGQLVYRRDVDRVEQFTGSAWVPVTPNEVGAWRFPAASTIQWTNQTTYGVVPDPTERAALTSTLVKTSSATRLAVQVSGCAAHSAGNAQTWWLGLRIGGVDYDVSQTYVPLAGAGVRATFTDQRIISGVPAGSLTIEPVFRSATASVATLFGPNAGDRISYSVREIP